MSHRGAIALVCSSCGADLSGFDSDAIFGCGPCSTAWEPGEQGLSGPFPILAADLPQAENSFTLPFWRLQLEPLLLPEGVRPIDYAFLPAYDMRKRSYFGDPGLTWTSERRAIGTRKTAGSPAGMTLRLDDARRLAWYYVLRTVDADHDISNFDLDISFCEPTVLLVDFKDENRFVVDPLTGKRFPVTAFPDLSNIRNASNSS